MFINTFHIQTCQRQEWIPATKKTKIKQFRGEGRQVMENTYNEQYIILIVIRKVI